MPNAAQTITINIPQHGVAQVLRSLLSLYDYRVVSSDLSVLTAVRLETGSVFRTRKNIRYEFAARWKQSGGKDELEQSTELSLSISERQNAWTQGHCHDQLKRILEELPRQIDALKKKIGEMETDGRFGNARWSNADELQQRDYLIEKPTADRFLVGSVNVWDGRKLIAIPVRETERHALICGPTGSGKTQSIFVPNLIERIHSSAIVTEATTAGKLPDLLSHTAWYRQEHGHSIYYFNPTDKRSHQINPIDAVRTVSDAQDLADVIIRNTTLNKHIGDQVWETSERQLLTALIMKAATEGGSLADIRQAIAKGRKALKSEIERAPAGKGRDEALALFDLSTEGFLNGVMVGLLVRLGPWLNPTVAALTRKTTIPLDSLRDQLFTLYLCVPAGARQLKPVAALILNFFLDRVLDQLADIDRLRTPLMLLLDELTNFGYIPDLPTLLTIMRHAHVPIVLGLQDVEQLKSVYGQSDAKIIFSQPATRVFFRPNELSTAREISAQLGQGTSLDLEKMSLYPRKLAAPEEVLNLDADRLIAFLPSVNPIKAGRIQPGQYQELYGEPPLPAPVTVEESLRPSCGREAELKASAVEQFPELLTEPTQTEEEKMKLEQNQRLKKRESARRKRARKIAERFRKMREPGE